MSHFAAFSRLITSHVNKAIAVMALLVLMSVGASAQCWSFYMYSPYAGQQYTRGVSTIPIQWGWGLPMCNYSLTAALQYSSNGGSSWTNIVTGLYGCSTSYNWVVPITVPATTTYLIKVRTETEYDTWGWVGSCYWNADAISGMFTMLPGCVKPTITTQPASSAVCINGSKTFTVVSDMTDGTYQWKKDGNLVAVTTTPSYTISPVQLSHAGNYTVTVIQNCNTSLLAVSASATLTVNVPPTVSKNPPATQIVCQSSDDTIKAGGTGVGKTFQWYKDGLPVAGGTDSNLILRNAQPTAAGTYYVVVTGTCSPSATSTSTVVTVLGPPVFTTEPTSLALCPGAAGQLTTVATGSTLTYQWYRNGVAVPVTTPNYPFTSYSTAMDGQYYVEAKTNVANPKGCKVVTRSAVVTVTGYRPPVLLTNPTAVEGCVGKSATLTGEFEGFGLTYSWTRNGAPIANASSNSLLLSNLTTADAGDYRVTATATCGLAVSSTPVRLNVVKTPTFSTQPTNKDLTIGEPLNLSVAASDATKIQWYKDGKILAGQTGTTLNIPAVTVADGGYYYATVTNACSGISSAYARVTVVDPAALQPHLTINPSVADMGEIPLGYDATRTFTGLIANTGNADMQVSDVSITDPGFAVTSGGTAGGPFTITAGGSTAVTIKATAENMSPMTGTLTVTTDAPVPTGTLMITATPVLRYNSPTSVAYGDIMLATSKDSCIAIMNNSSTDISIEQASITGPDGNLFSVVTPMPINIAAGASGEICVKFTPMSVGDNFTAQLNFTSSTGGNTTMALSGSAIVSDVAELDPANGVTVYPNPARDEVSIRTANASTITIVNNRGVKVASFTTTPEKLVASWNTKSFNGTTVAAGTYSVRISGLNGTVIVPLVIVR